MAVGMSYVMRQWRHRPVGRRRAGAVGVDRGLPDEVHGLGAAAAPVSAGFAAGAARGLRQRPARDPAAAAGLRRDARHVLHRPRPRRLAGGRAPAQPVPGELQPDRPQADRGAALSGHRAGAGQRCWFDVASALSDPEHPSGRAGHRRRRSSWPRRRSATWCYATGGNRRAADYAGINTDRVRFWSLVFCAACAVARRRSSTSPIYRSLQPVGRAAARARRDRGGDHRRRRRSSAATARSSARWPAPR